MCYYITRGSFCQIGGLLSSIICILLLCPQTRSYITCVLFCPQAKAYITCNLLLCPQSRSNITCIILLCLQDRSYVKCVLLHCLWARSYIPFILLLSPGQVLPNLCPVSCIQDNHLHISFSVRLSTFLSLPTSATSYSSKCGTIHPFIFIYLSRDTNRLPDTPIPLQRIQAIPRCFIIA